MTNKITKLTDKGYLVNGKAIYKYENDLWIPTVEFEYFEIQAFKKHLNAIQDGFKVNVQNVE